MIDESGKAGCKENGPFVLSATIIKDSDISMLENKLETAKLFKLPGIDLNAEIHAKEIVHGKKEYGKFCQSQRKDFLDELYKFIASSNITIIGIVMEKNDCKSLQGATNSQLRDKEAWYEGQAITLLIERIALFIKKVPDERLLIVVDETEFYHDRKVAARTSDEIEKGIYTSRISSADRLIQKPLFLPSNTFMPLQLADLVSYTIFKKFSKPTSSIFDFVPWFSLLATKFDTCPKGGYINCGLKVWHS